MKILLLGGTADARRLADTLHQASVLHRTNKPDQDIQIIYSLAGLVRVPKVDCELVVGGFTQFGGLAEYLRKQNIDMVLDVTHPYAQTMSTKAVAASKELGIPCWRFHRPAWQKNAQDNWGEYQSDEDLLAQLSAYHVPLLSAGQMTDALLKQILNLPNVERIVWRTAVAPTFSMPDKVKWIKAIGPFAFEDERQLLIDENIDVIVSKNSGGTATYSKLEAARELSLPALLHQRPELPDADREFSDTNMCFEAVLDSLKMVNTKYHQQKDSQQ